MAKYDGLIIPRSYNDYVNKSDPISVSQALQLTGVMDNAPTAQSTKPAKSGGIFAANAVIMANNKTLSGVAISAGSVVRVLFTAALTGSDATTGLTLTYNDTAYAVKIGKNGALANFNAYEVESGVFKYLQAYTTLELMFDGTQFIIIGNPVVLSNADYTIYPDGSITYRQFSIEINGDIYLTLQTFFQKFTDELQAFLVNNIKTTAIGGVWTGKSFFTGICYRYNTNDLYGEIEFENAQNNKHIFSWYYSSGNVSYSEIV